VRAVDALLEPGLGSHQHRQVEAVEHRHGGEGRGGRQQHRDGEGAARGGQQYRQHVVREPAGPAAQGRAERPGERHRQDGERHDRHRRPLLRREHREVLLHRVEGTHQRDGEHGEPQPRRAHGLTHPLAEGAPQRLAVRLAGWFGEPQREQRRGQAHAGAGPAHERIAAPGEQHAGGDGGGHLHEELGGGHPAVDPAEGRLGADVGEGVVHQRLGGTGHQCAADSPEHEARAEGAEPGREGPRREPRGLQHAGQDEDPATGPAVGQCPGRDLGHEPGDRPDREERGDLRRGQAGVEEQQRVQRVQRHELGQRGPADGQPGERPGGGRQGVRSGASTERHVGRLTPPGPLPQPDSRRRPATLDAEGE
jgi:hypothetical protein